MILPVYPPNAENSSKARVWRLHVSVPHPPARQGPGESDHEPPRARHQDVVVHLSIAGINDLQSGFRPRPIPAMWMCIISTSMVIPTSKTDNGAHVMFVAPTDSSSPGFLKVHVQLQLAQPKLASTNWSSQCFPSYPEFDFYIFYPDSKVSNSPRHTELNGKTGRTTISSSLLSTVGLLTTGSQSLLSGFKANRASPDLGGPPAFATKVHGKHLATMKWKPFGQPLIQPHTASPHVFLWFF